MLGEYKKIEMLGSGIFGEVWVVQHPETKKKYAAKVLKLNNVTEEQIKEVVTLMKKLKNPYLLEYFELFLDKETKSHVLLMEYCKSKPLPLFRY